MVSSISYLLGQNKRVVGFRRCKKVSGKGIGRTLAAKSIKFVGNRIVDAIANAVQGGSFKVSGVGIKPKATVSRKPRKTLTRRR